MAFKVAEGFVEFVPKIDASQAKRQVKDAVRDATKAAQPEAEKGGKESGERYGEGFKKSSETGTRSAFEKISGAASGAKDKLVGFGKMAGAGLAAGVLAGGAIVAAKLFDAMNLEAANDKLTAQLSLSEEAADKAGRAAANVYKSNWGDSIADVNDAIKTVGQNLVSVNKVGQGELEKTTTRALALRDAFEVDVAQSSQAAGLMIKNGMAKNAKEAFDIITIGFQSGNDRAGDWLDTLNEYAPQFKKLGIDGPYAFNLISEAINAGARNTDIAADLIKEFSIRSVDGTKLTAEGFKAAGLDAEKMADAIGKGGPSAQKAFQQTLRAVTSIKDPVKREAAGVALFGTQWEDLGPKAATAMATAETHVEELDGATDKLADTMGDNLAGKISSLKREGEVWANSKLLPFIEDVSARFSEDFLPALETARAFIADRVMPIVKDFGEKVLSTVRDNVRGITDAFRDNQPQLEMLADTLKNDVLPAIGPILVASIRATGLAFEYLIRAVGFAVDAFLFLKEHVADSAAAGLEAWKVFVSGVFAGVRGILGTLRGYAVGMDTVMGTNTAKALDKAIAGFEEFSRDTRKNLQISIDKLHDWRDEARDDRNTLRLKGEIRDIKQKIADAKRRLRDKGLTRPEKSRLQASLATLESQLRTAQRKLDALDGPTVPIYADLSPLQRALRQYRPIIPVPVTGSAEGGPVVKGMAPGGFAGMVRGPGTGTSDTAGLYALSNGEWVHRAAAVRKYGAPFMEAVNNLQLERALPMVGAGGVTYTGPIYVAIEARTALEFRKVTDLLSSITQQARARGRG